MTITFVCVLIIVLYVRTCVYSHYDFVTIIILMILCLFFLSLCNHYDNYYICECSYHCVVCTYMCVLAFWFHFITIIILMILCLFFLSLCNHYYDYYICVCSYHCVVCTYMCVLAFWFHNYYHSYDIMFILLIIMLSLL